MSFLTGYFLGGMNRLMIDNTARMTENCLAAIGHRDDVGAYEAENARLFDIYEQWREHALRLEADNVRLRAELHSRSLPSEWIV